MDKLTLGFYDARQKHGSMTLNVPELADGVAYDILRAQADALMTQLERFVVSGYSTLSLTRTLRNGTPANAAGVRGNKGVVRWFSAGEGGGEGQYGSNEFPCADISQFVLVGDKLLLQGAALSDFKAAFEAVARTENGNTVEVIEVEYLTRSV